MPAPDLRRWSNLFYCLRVYRILSLKIGMAGSVTDGEDGFRLRTAFLWLLMERPHSSRRIFPPPHSTRALDTMVRGPALHALRHQATTPPSHSRRDRASRQRGRLFLNLGHRQVQPTRAQPLQVSVGVGLKVDHVVLPTNTNIRTPPPAALAFQLGLLERCEIARSVYGPAITTWTARIASRNVRNKHHLLVSLWLCRTRTSWST